MVIVGLWLEGYGYGIVMYGTHQKECNQFVKFVCRV